MAENHEYFGSAEPALPAENVPSDSPAAAEAPAVTIILPTMPTVPAITVTNVSPALSDSTQAATADGTTGESFYTPAGDCGGVDWIIVSVSDGHGHAYTDTIAVNDSVAQQIATSDKPQD